MIRVGVLLMVEDGAGIALFSRRKSSGAKGRAGVKLIDDDEA